MVDRLIKATENIVAAIVRLVRWWFSQIARQSTWRGKAIVACVGLLAVCVVCSLPIRLINGPAKPAPVAVVQPSQRASSNTGAQVVAVAQPTEAPQATVAPTASPQPTDPPTLVPTNSPQPAATTRPKPIAVPTATEESTAAPAATEQPTSVPEPTTEPTAPPPTEPPAPPPPTAVPVAAIDHSGSAPQGRDCPPDYPIKGNINSKGEYIYHTRASRSYNRTIPERCFATEEDAAAAGFRAARDT